MHKFTLLIISLVFYTGASVQAEVMIASPNTRVSLLELYTSEGCSSCPPADAWVSKLKSHPGLWKSIVPVVFHVDYWNDIGWKDRFSSAEYSSRQRSYARSINLKTVYTPGFLLNGQEWRSFFGFKKPPTESNEQVGSLELTVNNREVETVFMPDAGLDESNYVLNIAVLGSDIKTDVKAGENRNRELKHDFTVLGYKTIPMLKNDSEHTIKTQFPDIIETAPRMAIAAWVNKDNDLTPIQAAGGWLDKD